MAKSEFEFSGDSSDKKGAEYTKNLLQNLATARDPASIGAQARRLAGFGVISEDVAVAINNFLKISKNKTVEI